MSTLMEEDTFRWTERLTWIRGVRQESRAADAGRQVIGGRVLRLVALLGRALPSAHLARPVLVVWEPPDCQDSIVAQADFIGRAVESRLRDPRVKTMKRSKVHAKYPGLRSGSHLWGQRRGKPRL